MNTFNDLDMLLSFTFGLSCGIVLGALFYHFWRRKPASFDMAAMDNGRVRIDSGYDVEWDKRRDEMFHGQGYAD